MVSFFRKNLVANVLSMPRPKHEVNPRGTRVDKGRKVRVGDSLRLQQDTALPPRCFAYSLLVQTKLPSQGSPKKTGKQNNTIVEINNKYFNLQTFKYFKQQLFIT
jgi:hypothetical protein